MPRKPRQRARPGDGTVFQLASGKWVAVVSIGGRQHRRRIRRVCASESAATEALRRLRSENCVMGGLGEEPQALDVHLRSWLAAQKPRLKPKTYVGYESTIRLYLLGSTLGLMRVDRIKSAHVVEHFAKIEADGVPPRSRELVFLRLRSVLECLVGRSIAFNPVRAVHRPRVARRTMTVWSQEQARAFLDSTARDKLAPLYRLALSVGMRRGELLALQWRDVDLKERRLSVQHTLTDDGELSEAKTVGSRRAIDLPERAAEALRAQKAALLARGLRASPWVFPDESGEPYNPRRLSNQFNAAIAKAKVPVIRFHDLRHTAATLMLTLGIHPKVVAETLGHRSIEITMDLYSHVTGTMQRDAAERMDAVL